MHKMGMKALKWPIRAKKGRFSLWTLARPGKGCWQIYLCAVAALVIAALAYSLPGGEGLASLRNRYDLALDFYPQTRQLDGVARVDYCNTAPDRQEEMYFHLYPNAFADEESTPIPKEEWEMAYPEGFTPGGMQVAAVRVDGKNVPVVLDGQSEDILCVDLPRALAGGERCRVEIEYSVTLPKLNYRTGQGANGFQFGQCYPILAVYDETGWNLDPYYANGDPFYFECADYRVTMTLPEELVLAHTGEQLRQQACFGRKRLYFEAENVREFAMMASRGYTVQTAMAGDVEIRSYAWNEEGGAQALEYAKDTVDFLSELLIPYDGAQLSVAQSDFYVGGMEYPHLVQIDETFYRTWELYPYLEMITVHETAHQWFYGLVGNDEVDEPWLDEALTEYMTMRYYGYRYDEAAEKRAFRNFITADLLDMAPEGIPEPPLQNSLMPSFEYANGTEYSAQVYARGAYALRETERYMGREAFDAALRTYVEQRAHQVATGDDLYAALEAQKPGAGEYLHDWLSGRKRILRSSLLQEMQQP